MTDVLKLSGKMRTIPMSDDKKRQITDYDVLTAMERYGVGFARSLADACFHADQQNLDRIKLAFVDLWEEYYKLAEKDKEKEDEAT